jgi:hypothetical protein
VNVADCYDPSSAGTLTCVKMLVTVLRAFLPPYLNVSQWWTISFVLVRMIRSSLHCIESPNPRSLTIKFKNHNLTAVRTKVKSVSFTVLFYGDPLNSTRMLYSNGRNHCYGDEGLVPDLP